MNPLNTGRPAVNTLEDFNLKLKQMYEDGMSLSNIGKEVGMSLGAIRNRLLAMEVTMRERGGPNNSRTYLEKVLSSDTVEGVNMLDIILDPNLSLAAKAERLSLHPSTIRLYLRELQKEDEK